MTKKSKVLLSAAIILLLLFVLWTALVLSADRAAIGPQESVVGLSGLNHAVHAAIGEHTGWYALSELLGFIALAVAAGFALWGAVQLLRGRSLRRVDPHLYLLAALYLVTAAVYVLFELFVVNCRPILVDGALEASYPSSHTILAVCIMASAAVRFAASLPRQLGGAAAGTALCIALLTVLSRILSGVHWISDIIGALLLSTSLVLFYCAADLALTMRE